MLGIIAAVLIVLWLLGFFAFHVTTGFIHIALVGGLILLVLHFGDGQNSKRVERCPTPALVRATLMMNAKPARSPGACVHQLFQKEE